MKFCQFLKKVASTKNRRRTKGREANLSMRERLFIGAIDPDEKPETLCVDREPVLAPFSLDQSRRALNLNVLEIENEEGSEHWNSIFRCFM